MPAPPAIPFPSDTKSHPLMIIDYQQLAVNEPSSSSSSESYKLYEASTTLGFFYLKLEPGTVDFEGLMNVGEKVFEELGEEDKKRWDVGLTGTSFGCVSRRLSL
jgi:isopenicillin N synthase-like dioxygenase